MYNDQHNFTDQFYSLVVMHIQICLSPCGSYIFDQVILMSPLLRSISMQIFSGMR